MTVGALNAVQINGEYLSRLYYFEIIGLFIPLIIGFVALNKLKKAKVHTELTTIAIITIIGCSLLGGIFMLCIKDEELKP